MPQSHTPVVGDHCTFLSLSYSDCNHSKCDRHCLETGCLPPVQCLVIKSGQPEVEGGVLNLLPTSWLLQLLAISCRMQTNSIPIIPSRSTLCFLLTLHLTGWRVWMLSLVKQVDVANAHLCAPVPKHCRHATKTCPSALPCLHTLETSTVTLYSVLYVWDTLGNMMKL